MKFSNFKLPGDRACFWIGGAGCVAYQVIYLSAWFLFGQGKFSPVFIPVNLSVTFLCWLIFTTPARRQYRRLQAEIELRLKRNAAALADMMAARDRLQVNVETIRGRINCTCESDPLGRCILHGDRARRALQ